MESPAPRRSSRRIQLLHEHDETYKKGDSKKRNSIPPKTTPKATPTPAPEPPKPKYPYTVFEGVPISESDPDYSLLKDPISYEECQSLSYSIEKSRNSWLLGGMFQKFWTRPPRGRKLPTGDTTAKEKMTKLCECNMIMGPHIFDVRLFVVKDENPEDESDDEEDMGIGGSNSVAPSSGSNSATGVGAGANDTTTTPSIDSKGTPSTNPITNHTTTPITTSAGVPVVPAAVPSAAASTGAPVVPTTIPSTTASPVVSVNKVTAPSTIVTPTIQSTQATTAPVTVPTIPTPQVQPSATETATTPIKPTVVPIVPPANVVQPIASHNITPAPSSVPIKSSSNPPTTSSTPAFNTPHSNTLPSIRQAVPASPKQAPTPIQNPVTQSNAQISRPALPNYPQPPPNQVRPAIPPNQVRQAIPPNQVRPAIPPNQVRPAIPPNQLQPGIPPPQRPAIPIHPQIQTPPPRPAAPEPITSPNNQATIAKLQYIAARDPYLNELMKIVASGKARPDQIASFQVYINRARTMPMPEELLGRQFNYQIRPAAPQRQVPVRPIKPPKPPKPPKVPKPPKTPKIKQDVNKKPRNNYTLKRTLKHIIIIFEFKDNPADRYVLPKNSIIETLPNGELLLSFLATKEVLPESDTKKSKGKKKDEQQNQITKPIIYFTPLTILIRNIPPRSLQIVENGINKPKKVVPRMEEILKNGVRTKDYSVWYQIDSKDTDLIDSLDEGPKLPEGAVIAPRRQYKPRKRKEEDGDDGTPKRPKKIVKKEEGEGGERKGEKEEGEGGERKGEKEGVERKEGEKEGQKDDVKEEEKDGNKGDGGVVDITKEKEKDMVSKKREDQQEEKSGQEKSEENTQPDTKTTSVKIEEEEEGATIPQKAQEVEPQAENTEKEPPQSIDTQAKNDSMDVDQ